DFLRDLSHDGQLQFCLDEYERNRPHRRRGGRRNRLRTNIGLGKFDSCLIRPMANLHYILAPAGIVHKTDLPPRWGLLSYSENGVCAVVKALWQESAQVQYVESAIARTLTGDIFRADDRAMASVNRELFAQQMALAD